MFKRKQIYFLLFVVVFATHFFSKVSYITDSRWTLHSCWALVHKHNLQIDEFKGIIEQNKYYAIDESKGHLYYSFPPGTTLLCSPFYAVMDKAAKRIYYADVFNNLNGYYHQGMELFLAAFFVALTVLLLLVVFNQLGIDSWLSVVMVLAFAYGTSAWTVASRGLFAHGPSMLCITAIVWALIKSKNSVAWLWLAGFLLGYSYVIRPTNSVVIVSFGLYILYIYKMQSWRAILPGAAVLLLFAAYNFSVYGQLLSPYYQPSHMGSDNHLFMGLAGNLFSPNRGLFIFSPFFLLLAPAMYAATKSNMPKPLLYAVVLAVVLHTLLISYFNNWYAGWCFGPRYFTDILPLLMILLTIGLQQIFNDAKAVQKSIVFSLFFLLAVISCGIHYKGANKPQTEQWNYMPNNIDENRNRVWDWNDMQLLR